MAELPDLRELLRGLRGAERPTDDRLGAGVAAGLGRHYGVDPMVLRLCFVVLGLANGVGVFLYLVLWGVLPAEAERPLGRRDVERPTADRAVGAGLVTLGLLIVMSNVGLVLAPGLVWSVAWSAAGFALVWARTSDQGRERWMGLARGRSSAPIDSVPRGRVVVLRAIAGGLLLVVGLAALLASGGLLTALGQIGLAAAATGVGVALLLGPWIVRLWRDLDGERRERIRSEERSDMAAHLHDSVLQTLTLIQRHADDAPGRARMLARRQERELRAWLYDERAPADGRPVQLLAALEQVVTEVEATHEVEVDLVVVGDAALDRRLEGLVAALREATLNAARHAGVAEVDVYVEVEPDRISAFVRDRGKGFDLATVEPGRLGVRESIVARMSRVGGRADVHSTPGEGTEIALELPTRAAAR